MLEITCAGLQIERLLQSLEDEYDKVEEFTSKHVVLIAPVWKVPPEILSYIFALSVPPSSLSELDQESSNPSLVLTHVNRYWRNVALSTPQLWTAIYIDAPTLQHELCVPKLLAERSGNYPLTVRAYHHRAYSEEIIEFLVSLSPRWEHVALDLCVEMMEGLRGIQGRLPSLRSVELTSIVRWRYDTPRAHLGFFSSTPLLRHMAIASPFIPEFRALPWQQLTSYDGPISVADIPRFFKLGHNLQECFIQPMRMFSNQTFPNDLTEMPDYSTLTSLHLSTGLMHCLSTHLEHLPKFPNLRRLFMHNDIRVTTTNPAQTLIPLFAMSGARLEELIDIILARWARSEDEIQHKRLKSVAILP